jgi:hypothetical protein
VTAVWVGPQAGGVRLWLEVGMEGRGWRWKHTNYSSHCAGCEVLPAIQLDLRLWERILDFRHLVCWVLDSLSVGIWKLLSQSETASIQLDTKHHGSREINWQTGLRGEEQREEENNVTRERKQKFPGSF